MRAALNGYTVVYFVFYVCGLTYTGMIVKRNVSFYLKYTSNVSQREVKEVSAKVGLLYLNLP